MSCTERRRSLLAAATGRQYPTQAAVAILEWMDFQKHDHEDGDDEQRMQPGLLALIAHPLQQFDRQAWRVKW